VELGKGLVSDGSEWPGGGRITGIQRPGCRSDGRFRVVSFEMHGLCYLYPVHKDAPALPHTLRLCKKVVIFCRVGVIELPRIVFVVVPSAVFLLGQILV